MKYKIGIITSILIVGFMILSAQARKEEFQYSVPSGFEKRSILFSEFIPTEFLSSAGENVSVLIAPSIPTKVGLPKYKKNQIDPDFLDGKRAFNQQFGIDGWKLNNYKFTETRQGERLELVGQFNNSKGKQNKFIEHLYYQENKIHSIQVIYQADADLKIVQRAIASLESYKIRNQ